MCANHIRTVCDFFKCIHVTINARTEEDVDPKLVIDKVCKSTGSAYNFKERSNLSSTNNSGPVVSLFEFFELTLFFDSTCLIYTLFFRAQSINVLTLAKKSTLRNGIDFGSVKNKRSVSAKMKSENDVTKRKRSKKMNAIKERSVFVLFMV